MDEFDVAGLALNERADPGAMQRPDEQITLPVPWFGTVLGWERAVVDAEHGSGEPDPSPAGHVGAAVIAPGV